MHLRFFPTVASSLSKSKFLSPGCPDSRCYLCNNNFSSSSMAFHTFSVSSLAPSAPTGQCVMHCPQREQSASSNCLMPCYIYGCSENLFLLDPNGLKPCTLSQTWIQRIHLIHLEESLISWKFYSMAVFQSLPYMGSQNIQIVGDLLKGTISTSVTGNTLAVMLGEYHSEHLPSDVCAPSGCWYKSPFLLPPYYCRM